MMVSRGPDGRPKFHTSRGGWMDHAESMVAGTAANHQRLILPVTEDGSPSEDEVREHYLNLL